jgi:hypothetical protein
MSVENSLAPRLVQPHQPRPHSLPTYIDIKVENGLRKVPEVVQVDDPCDTGSQEEE